MSEAAPALCDGRYRLVSELGAGGMATVYRAYDSRLQVERAIKVLSPNLARKRSLRTRFEGEASTMALLEHKNIVRVYDVGSDGDRIFIVMELVDGGSLLDRVKKHGPLPPRMAVRTTIDMLDALKVAHSRGVIHRDIKPHNVLLSADGIRITDFGIARIQKWDDDDSLTKTGSVMGTWGFMAPEQRVDAKSVDERADIYSVGATLYSVLTDRTPVDLFAADMDPKMMQGIGPEVAEVIKNSTRYDRTERYGSVDEMVAALHLILPKLNDDPADTPPLVDGMPLHPVGAGGGTGLIQRVDNIQTDDVVAADGGAMSTMVPEEDDAFFPSPLPDAETEKLHKLDKSPDSGLTLQPPDSASPQSSGLTDPAPRTSPAKPSAFGLEKVGVLVALVAVGFVLWKQLGAPDESTPAPVTVQDPIEEKDPVKDPVIDLVDDPVEIDDPGVDGVEDPVEVTPPVEIKLPVTPPPIKGLVHYPPASAKLDNTLNLKVNLPSSDYQVTVFYRPAGGTYSQKNLFGKDGSFSGPIPIDDRFAEGLEYWIKATPRSGGEAKTFKSGFQPHKVPVQ